MECAERVHGVVFRKRQLSEHELQTVRLREATRHVWCPRPAL